MRGSAGKNEVSRAQEEAQMAAWKEKRRLQAGDWRAPFTNPVEKNVPTFEAFEHEPGVWRDAASCDAPHRAPMKAIAAARPVLQLVHVLNTELNNARCTIVVAPACNCGSSVNTQGQSLTRL